MRVPSILAVATLISSTYAQETFPKSSKRGLVFVANNKYPSDNQIWVEPGSDLTWYYNYGVQPSPAYSNQSQTDFEFVPMLWGLPDASTSFLSQIQTLVTGGRNITHILTFNEPDGTTSTGGSAIDPSAAATAWIKEVQPLKKMGIKLGAPAVTGSPSGFTWLQEFFDACASQGTNCTTDFIPVHWYGNFEGLASHIGQVIGTYVIATLPYLLVPRLIILSSYPNKTVWITEYALSDQPLEDTQSFFNTSASYFDRIDYIERYSYFGSFRSSVSNVGPNAAMLTQKGELTDIGSWYLGGAATNNVPKGTAAFRKPFTASSILISSIAAGFLLL
jgi:hypothetical protein